MKSLFPFVFVLNVLAINPSQYQSIADAIRKRVALADSEPHSNHLIQAQPQKHDPFIVFSGDTATLKVRGPDASITNLHPQTPEHHISYIWVEDEQGRVVHLAELQSTDNAPTTDFSWTGLEGTLTPYSLCNKHGLFQGPTYTLEQERGAAQVASLMDGSKTGPNSFHPYGEKLVKHSPFVASLKHGIANMGVAGSDDEPTTVFHVQTPEHFIATLYVKDQHGAVAGLRRLTSSDGARMHTVSVKSSATELTPFEYCNLHGLWEGPKFVLQEQEL